MKRHHRRTASAPAGELVQFVPPAPDEADYDRLADTLFEVAAEVVAAEDRIKRAAVAALERGDSAEALALLRRWLVEPPTTVAASLGRHACGS